MKMLIGNNNYSVLVNCIIPQTVACASSTSSCRRGGGGGGGTAVAITRRTGKGYSVVKQGGGAYDLGLPAEKE